MGRPRPLTILLVAISCCIASTGCIDLVREGVTGGFAEGIENFISDAVESVIEDVIESE